MLDGLTTIQSEIQDDNTMDEEHKLIYITATSIAAETILDTIFSDTETPFMVLGVSMLTEIYKVSI